MKEYKVVGDFNDGQNYIKLRNQRLLQGGGISDTL